MGTLLVSGLSGLALPGLNAFVSEFLVIVGTFQRYPVAAVLGATGVILAALYILLWYQKMATGPQPVGLAAVTPDMTMREKFVVAPLIAAFLVLGFYPKPVIDLLEPAVTTTLQYVGVTDPAPTVTAEGSEG
jgi:NADH-quinone oxidoreductase subunit M